eukprot:879027-Pelagomonas_calceolata.AAC.2
MSRPAPCMADVSTAFKVARQDKGLFPGKLISYRNAVCARNNRCKRSLTELPPQPARAPDCSAVELSVPTYPTNHARWVTLLPIDQLKRKAKCNTIMIDPASGKASMQRETRAPEQKLQQQLASDGRSQGALTAKAAHLASLREGAHVLQQQARPGHDLGCDCVQVAEERACKPSLGLIQS